MNCHKARSLISEYLDQRLTAAEVAPLEEHFSQCLGCNRELAFQRKIKTALQEIGREEAAVPAGFSKKVMGSLKEKPVRKGFRLPASWGKVAVAAAAMLVLVGGVSSFGDGQISLKEKIFGPSQQLVVAEKDQTASKGGSLNRTDEIPRANISYDTANGDAVIEEAGPVQDTGAADPIVSDPGTADQDVVAMTQIEDAIDHPEEAEMGLDPEIATEDTAIAPAVAGAGAPAKVALMQEGSMKAYSTILKVNTTDYNASKAKASAMATEAGATVEVYPEEQKDGKKTVFIRITIATDKAENLIAGLSSLGVTADRQDDARDRTIGYNDVLVRQNDLNDRLDKTEDPLERQQLEAQAASYKKQLADWDEEVSKQTISLWFDEE